MLQTQQICCSVLLFVYHGQVESATAAAAGAGEARRRRCEAWNRHGKHFPGACAWKYWRPGLQCVHELFISLVMR